jgi:serine phosphatase RsbU (regulator of sigma subunit)
MNRPRPSLPIRTQLALAFVTLAVLPLAAIVLYSYGTSRSAVQKAVRADSVAMAEELTERLSAVRGDLRARLEALGALAVDEVLVFARDPGAPEPPDWLETAALVMADIAPLVESLELVTEERAPPPAPPPPRTGHESPPRPLAPPPAPPEPRIFIDLPELIRLSVAKGLAASAEGVREARSEVAEEVAEGLREAQAEIARERAHLAEARRREGRLRGRGDRDPAGREVDSAFEAFGQAMAEITLRITEDAMRLAAEAAAGGVEAGRVASEESLEAAAEAAGRTKEESGALARPEREELARQLRSVVELRERHEAGGRPDARGPDVRVEILRQGAKTTELRAALSRDLLLRHLLDGDGASLDEVRFAVDEEGALHLPPEADAQELARLAQRASAIAPQGAHASEVVGDWMVVATRDPDTQIVFGVARPLREPLQALRRTAARNFGWGLGLIALALLGVLPLATHLTKDLAQVTAGAERIAAGDLSARVPVRTGNEIGALAATFNRMAEELVEHQQKLVEQRLLEAELARRADELEEARRLQLSLLPRTLPQLPGLGVAVAMRTATEVGGDYYDFQITEDGALVVAIGDATGHGAQAGTMVTVLKGLFSAWPGGPDLAGFLALAGGALRRMELGRMLMAFALVRVQGTRVSVASAGMPPVLVWRRQRLEVEEIDLPGLPLGSLAESYRQAEVPELAAGDVVLLMSDGLAELQDPEGEPFGYPRIRERLAELAERPPEEILAGLMAAAEAWAQGGPLQDDLTFVVLRLGD